MPYRYVTEHRRDGRLKRPAATARTAMHLARHVKPSASLSRRSANLVEVRFIFRVAMAWGVTPAVCRPPVIQTRRNNETLVVSA